MSTLKSNNEDMTINADGASSEVKFQANGVEKASISAAGAFTSTTIDATKLTGNLPAIDGSSLTNLPAGGKVLQVVSATQTSSVSTTSASMVDTGLTATITPTADDSTILVFSTISLYTQSVSGDTRIGGKLLRDAVSLFSNNYVLRSATGGNDKRIWAVNIEDSPTTTSELVYKMQFCRTTGSGTIYVGINSEPSSMILMEIGA